MGPLPSLTPFGSQYNSQPPTKQVVGLLERLKDGSIINESLDIAANEDFIIGRDGSRCSHLVSDPHVSNKHLRIYNIVFEESSDDNILPLVYAEDLSRNGTYLNNSLIPQGFGGVLLTQGDVLRLTPRLSYRFSQISMEDLRSPFDGIQLQEMKAFATEYTVTERKLGSGASGAVFMALTKHNNAQLACKMVDLRLPPNKSSYFQDGPTSAKGQEQEAAMHAWATRVEQSHRLKQRFRNHQREAHLLASLSHPNIIGIEKIYFTTNSIYIFQDLITGGDLFSYLERKGGRLSDVETAVIVRQIVIAVDHLHDNDIVHRDLKPENVLMTSLATGCRVVLTDFGHSVKLQTKLARMNTMAGTEQYTAPEIIQAKSNASRKGYTKAVDMWSIGCIAAVLLTGTSPFADPKTFQHSRKLAKEGNLEQLENAPEWISVGQRPMNFVKRLLVPNEEARLTAKEALGHEWFANEFHKIDFEDVYQRATQNWKRRMIRKPIVDIKHLKNPERVASLITPPTAPLRDAWRGTRMPIDPPYRTYSKRLDLAVNSRPSPRSSATVLEEVDRAIAELWPPTNQNPLMRPVSRPSDFDAASRTRIPDSSRPREFIFTTLANFPAMEEKTSSTKLSLFNDLRRKLFSPRSLIIDKALKNSIVRRFFEIDKDDIHALKNLDQELKTFEPRKDEQARAHSRQRRRLVGLAKNPLKKSLGGSGIISPMGPPPPTRKRTRSIFDVDDDEGEDGDGKLVLPLRKTITRSIYGTLSSKGSEKQDATAYTPKESSSSFKLLVPSLSSLTRISQFLSGDGFTTKK